MELEEKKIYEMFKIRIKRWSYFALLFSAYVLLNVCIGFSSAPFYQHNIECYLYDPTEICASLQSKATRLYVVELLIGILMMTQGIIALILVDNIQSQRIANYLNKISKFSLVAYLFLFLLRIGLFFDVHSQIAKVEDDHIDKGFGSFFAEYVTDTTGSIILTLILFVLFFLFYASIFCIIKIMNKMMYFFKS